MENLPKIMLIKFWGENQIFKIKESNDNLAKKKKIKGAFGNLVPYIFCFFKN